MSLCFHMSLISLWLCTRLRCTAQAVMIDPQLKKKDEDKVGRGRRPGETDDDPYESETDAEEARRLCHNSSRKSRLTLMIVNCGLVSTRLSVP